MKTNGRLITLNKVLSILIILSMLAPGQLVYAEFGRTESAYMFGVQGRTMEDIQSMEYSKPVQMVTIIPGRPVAARDKEGNRLFFSPNGKLSMTMTRDGKRQFSLGSQKKTIDTDGKIESQSSFIAGTNKSIVKDGSGEITKVQTHGFGGKVISEFDLTTKDAQGKLVSAKQAIALQSIKKFDADDKNSALVSEFNTAKSYVYDKYGSAIEYVVDELTQTKTVFGSNKQPAYDINYEGQIVATYEYDKNKLISKTDNLGNKTFFDETGNMTHTTNIEGANVLQYTYENDENGNVILTKSEDMYGAVTFYEKGKPQVTKSPEGEVLKEWTYDEEGQTLLYTFDPASAVTTWYDTAGRKLYDTADNNVVREWMYYEGKLVGMWDSEDNSLLVYERGSEINKVYLAEKPEAQNIQEWLDEGYLTKQYIKNDDDKPVTFKKAVN